MSDDAYLTSLRTYRQTVLDQRNAIMAEGPKPNYTSNGKSYDWAGYLKLLSDELDKVNAQIAAGEGPFEMLSFADT